MEISEVESELKSDRWFGWQKGEEFQMKMDTVNVQLDDRNVESLSGDQEVIMMLRSSELGKWKIGVKNSYF